MTAGRRAAAGILAVPPGSGHNPSAPRARAPVVVLAFAGFAISTYLALFQYGVLGTVWDPFFGDGSREVLTSEISRLLPVKDAALGAAMYLFEGIVELAGGRTRWRDRPWIVLLLGATAAGLAVTGVVLTIAQPLLTGSFCTLCLTSAAISLGVAALVASEVRAAVGEVRRRLGDGVPIRDAVTGPAGR